MREREPIEQVRSLATRLYGEAHTVEPLSQLNHKVYRITLARGTRVIKLAAKGQSHGLARELGLVRRLATLGIPVPRPEFDDLDGKQIGLPYVLYHDAGSTTALDRRPHAAREDTRLPWALGEVLGRIHDVSFESGGELRGAAIVPRDEARERDLLHQLAMWARARGYVTPEDAEGFRRLALPTLDGRSLCHNDFHPGQCVVEETRIVAVLDWDEAWSGNPGIDLAIGHTYFDFFGRDADTEAFLAGYKARRGLPEEYERAYLPVRMAHALGMLRVFDASGQAARARRAAELFRGYSGQERAWQP